MMNYSPSNIEALTNWDGMLCKKPWRNTAEERQYYSRFINRLLWRYFTEEDWQNLAVIVDDLRIDRKLKLTTKFLLQRHLKSVENNK